MRVRFLSELEMAEGKERAVNTGFEGQSRIQEDHKVENTSYPAGVLSSPPSLPPYVFLPGQRAAPSLEASLTGCQCLGCW